MSTNKKYVGEEAARVLAAGIGAATPRTWDLTPDDLDSVTEEEQDGMVLMQFPTPARLKASLADIKTGDRLDASSVFGISACHLTVTTVLRDDASDGTFYHVLASMDSADDGIVYNFCIGNDNVAIVLLPLVEPDPSKLSASAGGSSWKYGAIPNWGDVYQSAWFYTDHGSSSMPHDFKVGDIFRTPTLVPYGSPPSVASSDPADQPSANYAEGTIVGTGKVQNVPYLVVVGAARFGKKTSATAKDDETITAPGIFYVTHPSTNYWYVKFYPLLNKWKELEKIAGEILVISAGLGIANKKVDSTRDKLGMLTNAAPPRVIVGRLPKIGSDGTHNYYLTPKLQFGAGTWIPVNLNTRAFRRWCGNAEIAEPFIIESVGLQRVYLSVAPGDYREDILPSISPVNISVENGVATITKKTLGAINPSPYGLFADMAVYARVAHSGPNTNDGNRLIVRYDEERGWVACNSPWGAGSFAIDKLAPPTYAEVVNVLFNHNSRRRNNYIQIQFRSRAVKPKGATATEATKKYHFWSYKKKWGAVFRVRRTHGGRYGRTTDNPDTGSRVKSPSYAHRNFGASEWHYYSVKWSTSVDPDGKKERRIAALRRLG